MGGSVDGQGKGVSACAIISVGVVVGICTRYGVFDIIPCICVTGSICIGVVGGSVDGQRQCVSAGTTVGIGLIVCVGTC